MGPAQAWPMTGPPEPFQHGPRLGGAHALPGPRLAWEYLERKHYFLTRHFLCGRQVWPTRAPPVAHPWTTRSLSKCPAYAERNSVLHGCPICPIGLIFFPHLHKFGRWVLTTCENALVWPCTTWRRVGPCLASRPPSFVNIPPNYQPAARARPDFSAV